MHDQRQPLRPDTDAYDDDVRFLVAFTFVIEFLIVVGLALLEYYLRSVSTSLEGRIYREERGLIPARIPIAAAGRQLKVKKVKERITVNGFPSHSYGTSLAIWDHTVLPATRHK